MPKFVPVSRERHATSRWRTSAGLAMAARNHIVPVTMVEMSTAAVYFPLCFVQAKDAFTPAAILGLQPGRNLFVSPKGGWLAAYMPLAFRTMPFSLRQTPDGQPVLVVDEEQVTDSQGPEGQDFYDREGKPAAAVTEVMRALNLQAQSGVLTARACAALQQHGLIQPWPVTLKTPQGEKTLQGIFKIDDKALDALPDEAFLSLRQNQALPLAYYQLLSIQHFPLLGRLSEAHAKAAAAAPGSAEASSFPIQNDTISFDALG